MTVYLHLRPIWLGRVETYQWQGASLRAPGYVPQLWQVWEQDVPYNIAMVELDEGVRMLSNVIGCQPEQAKIGDRVSIIYEDATDEISLPKFHCIE